MSRTLVLMAAGSSARYGRLKQTEPIGPAGETIADYSAFDALRAGFTKLVVVVREDLEDSIRSGFGDRIARHIDTRYVYQDNPMSGLPGISSGGRTKPWGTAHAILSVEKEIDGPFAVVNADDFYGANSFQALSEHIGSGSPHAGLVSFTLRNTLSPNGTVIRGICKATPGGELERVDETMKIEADGDGAKFVDHDGISRPLTGDEPVSMNMWAFPGNIFPDLQERWDEFISQNYGSSSREFFIPDMVTDLILLNRLRCKLLPSFDKWYGLTHQKDSPALMARVRELTKQGVYGEPLWV